MRFHFQETPWDLYLSIGYTIVVALALGAFGGNAFALLLIFFMPGYVLIGALFPSSGRIDWLERIGLSMGASIAVVTLLGLGLNFTHLGIRFETILTTIGVFTISVGFAALWRRKRLPVQDRLSGTVRLDSKTWSAGSRFDRLLTLVLVSSALLASSTVAYVVLTPRFGERFTDFYLLGPSGNASAYPTLLNVSQAGTVILGLANHESEPTSYTVQVDLIGLRVNYNTTSKRNETIETNSTIWSTFEIHLANGQYWSRSYTFRIDAAGLWKVRFLLFKVPELSSSYKQLHLTIQVT